MGSILIAMPNTTNANQLADILRSRKLLHTVEICRTGTEVLRIANERDYGVVICTRNLKDMSSLELVDYLPKGFGMVLMTKDATMDIYSDRVVKLIMPLKPSELLSTVEMVMSGFHKEKRKRQKAPPKRNASEKAIVDQAKQLLMERNGLTEPEAFRYIQKTSMDMGRSMVESAQMILMLNTE